MATAKKNQNIKQIPKINIPIFKRPSLFNLAKKSVELVTEKINDFTKKSVELAKEKINNFSDRIISYIIPEKKKATIEQVKILNDDIQKIYKKNLENKKAKNKVITAEINEFRKKPPEKKKAINDLFKEELNKIYKNKQKTYQEI